MKSLGKADGGRRGYDTYLMVRGVLVREFSVVLIEDLV
jgi:hypothetical protein